MCAYVRADTDGLWDYYWTLSNTKVTADAECETIQKSLKTVQTQIDTDKKGCQSEIEGLKRKVDSEEKKTKPNRRLISECEQKIEELERHITVMHRKKQAAVSCLARMEQGQNRYATAIASGKRHVSSYLDALESSLSESGTGAMKRVERNTGNSDFYAVSFGGHIFYCNDSAIDIHRRDGKGRTNLERMREGKAPIGEDGFAINLHHMQQSDSGSFMELTWTIHKVNDRTLHINKGSGIPSGINRLAFERFKQAYWKQRALRWS